MAQLWDRLQAALGDAYRLERELGGGGMSRVFAAREISLARQVVVKVLPPETASGVNADRFRREIQLAASLQHPHIVPLLTAGHHDDLVYYTMPLIEGESLRAKLAREGELPIAETIRILRDISDALAYAHAHGVVHRDIKPDNILLTGQHAVVTDFGVAKALSDATGSTTITSLGVALGTPAYMAPEQASADPHVDHRADIYALGALAYELLTGRPPFVGANPQQVLAAHVTQAPDPVARHRGAVPPALAALVMRCLEKRAADRWQWAAEVRAQLEAMATPSGGTARTGAASAVRRHRWWRVAAAVGLVVVAGGYALLRRPAGSALDPTVVAVIPFRVAGADPGLHYLREGMLDLLAALLTGEGGPRAADPRTVMSAWRRAGGDSTTDVPEDAALGVARRIGAGHALFGAAVGSQSRISLSATLMRVSDGTPEARAAADGPADSLPALASRLASELLLHGAHLGQSEASLTTTSLEALRAYLAGRAAYRIGNYPEAARQLEDAIDKDSTFAWAAFQLLLTGGWTTIPDHERARRLAFVGRSRLIARDSMLVEAYIGAHYPEPSTEAELLAARETLVLTASDDPEAWYILGDKYFHMGQYLGHDDWAVRSRAALGRAVALDSTFAGPIEHLIELALDAGDTSEVRRLASLFREIQSDDGLHARFVSTRGLVVAYALHDSARIRDAWARLDTARVPPLVPVAQYYGLDPVVLDRLMALERRAISNEGERRDYWNSRAFVRFNQGRVRDAVAAVDSIVGARSSVAATVRLIAALYWEEDSAAASRAAATVAAVLENPGRIDPAFPAVAHRMGCFLAQWRATHGDFAGAALLSERIRHLERTDPPWVQRFGAVCPAIVDAMVATLQRRSDARRLADRADSIMLLGPSLPPPNFENFALSRVFAGLGDSRRALAVIRRGSPGSPNGLVVPYLREEARLAAQVGDRGGAIRAYQRYLAMRYQPDSAIQVEVNQVRAELARLVGESGNR